MKPLTCANPACRRKFTLDADHRHAPFCCAICQRECTPRTTGGRFTPASPNAEAVVSAKPAPIRKHAKQNWEATE